MPAVSTDNAYEKVGNVTGIGFLLRCNRLRAALVNTNTLARDYRQKRAYDTLKVKTFNGLFSRSHDLSQRLDILRRYRLPNGDDGTVLTLRVNQELAIKRAQFGKAEGRHVSSQARFQTKEGILHIGLETVFQ
jgi:hypothetical protein